MSGILYICGTPIGNLEDITLRQLRIFQEVDIIACEDTRVSIKLLNHYNIKTKLISYHEHNERSRGDYLISMLKEGKDIALISDAGMPLISDPGLSLVGLAYDSGITVTTVPSATAVISGLVLSGFETAGYVFCGFFPRENKEKSKIITRLKAEEYTTIFYESPHRLLKTLQFLHKNLGERKVATAKELTKRYETVLQNNLENLVEYYTQNPPKGEFVLIIEGAKSSNTIHFTTTILEDYEVYIKSGLDSKEAMKKIARERSIGKREVYEKIKIKQK